ncbi:MAG: DUF192 domain-containing protein [Myxococcota bacterium]
MRIVRWALLVALAACNGAARRQPVAVDATPAVVLHPAGRAPVRVRVEVARTPEERARGLMFRERLDADAGMIFLFERSEAQSFWMKNTKIPLDMIFIDEKLHVVGVVEGAEPMSEEPRGVGIPSRTVLEVNAGFARENAIVAGTPIEWQGLP